jgi:hypothetical protein
MTGGMKMRHRYVRKELCSLENRRNLQFRLSVMQVNINININKWGPLAGSS